MTYYEFKGESKKKKKDTFMNQKCRNEWATGGGTDLFRSGGGKSLRPALDRIYVYRQELHTLLLVHRAVK